MEKELYNFSYLDMACMANVYGHKEQAHESLKKHSKWYLLPFVRYAAFSLAELSLLKRNILAPNENRGGLVHNPNCASIFKDFYDANIMFEYTIRPWDGPERILFVYLSPEGENATIMTCSSVGDRFSVLGISRNNLPRFVSDTCGLKPNEKMIDVYKRKYASVKYGDFVSWVATPRGQKKINFCYEAALVNASATHPGPKGTIVFHPLSCATHTSSSREGLVFLSYERAGGLIAHFPDIMNNDSVGDLISGSKEAMESKLKSILDRIWAVSHREEKTQLDAGNL